MSDSKFTAGMRVAKVSGFSGNAHTEAFIEKVYKNGNFILRGDQTRQQWRPTWRGDLAGMVGETSRYATTIKIWDEVFDIDIAKEAARKEHVKKSYELETKIKAMRFEFLSADALAELEAVVNKITTPEPETTE